MSRIIILFSIFVLSPVSANEEVSEKILSCVESKLAEIVGSDDPINLSDIGSIRLKSCRKMMGCSGNSGSKELRINAPEGTEILADSIAFARTSFISSRAKVNPVSKQYDEEGNIISASVSLLCKRESKAFGGGCGVGGVLAGIAVPKISNNTRDQIYFVCATEAAS